MARLTQRAAGRIAAQRVATKLSTRYEAKPQTLAGTVAGRNLATVDGRLVRAEGLENYAAGTPVTLTNVGSPGVAVYAPQGTNVAYQVAGGGTTSGTTAAGRPYATITVAAYNTQATDKENADYICDGTDDHTTISAALTKAGHVVLLEGTYRLGGSISVVNNVHISGAGVGSTVIQATTAAPILSSAGYIYQLTISRMTLDCANIQTNCVNLDQALRCVFDDVIFTRCSSAAAVAMRLANSIRFLNCDFQLSGTGIQIDSATGVEVANCKFLSCNQRGIVFSIPLRCSVTGSTFRQCAKGLVLGEKTA